MRNKNPTDPVHPGEILLEDFMKPAGISIDKLAHELCVPVSHLNAIVNESCGITDDTARRLGQYFSNSAEIWMNLQRNYELRLERSLSCGFAERRGD